MINNWTVGGTGSESVDIVSGSDVYAGTYAFDLVGTPGPGSMSQTLANSAGLHTVSFYGKSTGGGLNDIVNVSLGASNHTFTLTNTWSLYSVVLSGSGSDVFTMSSNPANTGNGNTSIDDVKVEAVPEPASMTALGLGIAALLRRRKKS